MNIYSTFPQEQNSITRMAPTQGHPE